MDKVTIYRVLWSTLKLDATNRHGLADVITLEDHRRALDAERERLKGQIDYSIQLQQLIESLKRDDTPSPELYHHTIIVDFKRQLATLQAQLARWKEALGEWLWNCTNLLGDYHIKTVQDFNEEVNRRIAWLMQHLDYTLPPPMTDEERDRMRKLSEVNDAQRALDAERERVAFLEKKNANLVEASNLVLKVKAEQDEQLATLQAQLEALRQERDEARHSRDVFKSQMIAHMNDRDSYAEDLTTLQAQLRQVEGERDRAEGALIRAGFRKDCDIAACNCGPQWGHGGHASQRLREIADALPYQNGGVLLERIESLVRENATLRQLVTALPVVDVKEVSVWLSPDESGWLVSKRPAFPAGLYWAKFRTQAEADSFRALLAYRATLAAQDAPHPTEERS